MNKEINEIATQLKEILNKYPNRQLEILIYVFGRDNLLKIINKPTYEELEQENNQLKEQKKELRSWLKDFADYSDCIKIISVLNKLNELTGKEK